MMFLHAFTYTSLPLPWLLPSSVPLPLVWRVESQEGPNSFLPLGSVMISSSNSQAESTSPSPVVDASKEKHNPNR